MDTGNTEQKRGATHTPILNPVEARQGVISGRVKTVLAVSTTLVVVAFVVIYAVSL